MSTPTSDQQQTPSEEIESKVQSPVEEQTEDVEMNDVDSAADAEAPHENGSAEPVEKSETEPLPTPTPAPEQIPEQQPQEPELTTVDYSEESKKIEEKAKIYLARQTKTVIIPGFAAWFNFESIHEIEKRSLPEFFNNNSRFKTDKIYQDIRNFMINAYRLNATEYLTVTAARRNVAADVASIIRIHAFLEQWGLINYQIDPKTKPSMIGPQYTGHFQIILDTPDGLKPFIPENAEVINVVTNKSPPANPQAITNGGIKGESTQTTTQSDYALNMELRKNVYDSTHDAIALNESERVTTGVNAKTFTCTVTGNDITEVRYHNLKTKGSISAKSFKEGNFGGNFTSADFIRLEKLQKNGDFAPWSNQETLLLLEGLEMYEDDWEKISQHVSTKTKEQCITKFIQLPIEDKYLIKTTAGSKKPTSQTTTGGVASTNDAVIQTIKFLIKNLDPQLASKDILENDEDVQRAIKLTLGSVLGGAQAQQELIKRESSELVTDLVELQIAKIEQKLAKVALLEKRLNQEKAELASQRKEIILDRLSLKKQAVEVRTKLVEAAQSTDVAKGAELAGAALEIALKAPRVAIISSSSSQVNGVVEDQEKDKEAVEQQEVVVPVSMDAPETYKYWKE